MSSEKSSVIGPLLMGAALSGATGLCLYLLLRKDEDFLEYDTVQSVQEVTIEMRIPTDCAGVVIGRQGSNIREIQSRTNTKINFKDEIQLPGHRLLTIRGGSDEAQLAEVLINQCISSQPRLETLTMHIPHNTTPRIIGRNGESVKNLELVSRCRIKIESSADEVQGSLTNRVTIRGTSHQIGVAKSLIEKKVEEVEYLVKTMKNTKGTRQDRIKYDQPLFLQYEQEKEEDQLVQGGQEILQSTSSDNYIQVYVSSVSNPSWFSVQNIGPSSIDLDKLTEEMTSYYSQEENQIFHSLATVNTGDIVVASCEMDQKFYRAKVVSVKENEYDSRESVVDIDFLDYGDCGMRPLTELFEIRGDFLKLKFQAVTCSLAYTRPAPDDSDWSSDCIDQFELLTHCANWKPMWAKIIDSSSEDSEKKTTIVELFDNLNSGGEKSIGLILAKLGLATYKLP